MKLAFWDTTGQERFESVTATYFKGAHVCLLIFDLTNFDSLEKVKFWHNKVKEVAEENVIIVLVGNKSD